MKTKLWLYHEQWVDEGVGEIIPWHIEVGDKLSGSKLRIFLKMVEVEIPDVPLLSEDVIKKIMVSGMRQEIEDIQSDAHMKCKNIEDRIQELLCLTQFDTTKESVIE